MMTPEIAQTLVGHTPGPWKAIVAGNGDGLNEVIVDNGYNPFISVAFAEGDDARLIAAAPALLTAYLASVEENERLREALTEADNHFGPFADITINGMHDPEDVRVVKVIRTALKPKEPKP